jgi:cysteine desulfurase family protein
LNRIYLDNAATSFPKAPGVVESMTKFIAEIGTSVHRTSKSFEAEQVVFQTRELLCQLFNFDKPENVVFTKNVTESLNLVIKGLFRPGDHAIVSSMEHNAVMRPLLSLSTQGVTFSRAATSSLGNLNPQNLLPLIRPETKAIIMTHASNVSGNISPLAEIGDICRKHNLFFIVDAAQSAGCLPIDMQEMNIDALAFTGHKSLLGPQGIGGLLLRDVLAQKIPPFIEGGTGSFSESEEQPDYLPDKFESGTLNLPGIYGLNAALEFVLKTGIKTISEHEKALTTYFLNGLLNIKGAKTVGPGFYAKRAPLVSVDFPNCDNADIAYRLLNEHHIITRVGLHCAPNAHKTLDTFPQGTVRFSFCWFNTRAELQKTLEAIEEVLKDSV